MLDYLLVSAMASLHVVDYYKEIKTLRDVQFGDPAIPEKYFIKGTKKINTLDTVYIKNGRILTTNRNAFRCRILGIYLAACAVHCSVYHYISGKLIRQHKFHV